MWMDMVVPSSVVVVTMHLTSHIASIGWPAPPLPLLLLVLGAPLLDHPPSKNALR